MLGKPFILSLFSTCLMNSMKQEHSCKILYLQFTLVSILFSLKDRKIILKSLISCSAGMRLTLETVGIFYRYSMTLAGVQFKDEQVCTGSKMYYTSPQFYINNSHGSSPVIYMHMSGKQCGS